MAEVITATQLHRGLIKGHPEETVVWDKALIEPGREEPTITLAPFSAREVETLFQKLNMLALYREHPGIAAMVAEEADSILVACRKVKTETKQDFRGILGAGMNLEIGWLRAKDVGGELTDQNTVAGKGAYGIGPGGGVYSWLNTFTAGVSVDMFPEATLIQEAGIIFLGFIDPIEVPKVEAIQFTLAGMPSPPQSLAFRVNQEFGGPGSLPFARLEKPVFVGPQRRFAVTVNPGISGDSKCEPLALLITAVEKHSLA